MFPELDEAGYELVISVAIVGLGYNSVKTGAETEPCRTAGGVDPGATVVRRALADRTADALPGVGRSGRTTLHAGRSQHRVA